MAGGLWFIVKRREKQAEVSALELWWLKTGRSSKGLAKLEGRILPNQNDFN